MSHEPFPVYIIDEIVPRPGQAKTLFDAYLTRYAPGATARGMTLAHSLVEPAYWEESGANRLVFVWSLPGPGAVWGKNFMSRQDQEVAAWWAEVDQLALSRRRSTLCDGKDIAKATDV
jgi:hypothetical protein